MSGASGPDAGRSSPVESVEPEAAAHGGPGTRYRSKTWAAWLAVVGGAAGLHRLYLRGTHDRLAWLHLVPTLIGLVGVIRMRELGQDDRWSWLLIPILGLMITQGMLHAIRYGLMPDERWDARFNPGQRGPETRWGPVLAAMTALLVGAAVLMGTIAFGGQKFFEWQFEDAQRSSQRPA